MIAAAVQGCARPSLACARVGGPLAAVHFLIDELKAQVPIWKKEIYAGESACWKENKESSAPVIGQQQQRAADTNKMLAAAAAGAAALVLSAFLAVRARR